MNRGFLLRIKEVRSMNRSDLDNRLAELRLELMKEVGNVKRGRPTKNPGKIRVLKRDIARILTVKKHGEGKK
ncbi:MAG: 50S ribosomal protein L29 [Candidatus Aenigmarchaeota archaeon]|nr:50S ribosomal protein L29 [Candidatus Aenigmarchaeota archaeon]